MEVLKQGQYKPMAVEDQVLIFYALSQRHLNDIPVNRVLKFQMDFLKYIDKNHQAIKKEIRETGEVSTKLEKQIDQIVDTVKEQYNYH